MLNDRSQILLKTLVERYIAEGQPIGSKALQHFSGLDISSATIRNTMVDLEALGFVASPHTSAGRIPTVLGYRLFVDSLLTVQTLDSPTLSELQLPVDSPQRSVAAASQVLSQLTQFAGLVQSPRRHDILLKQIEFMQLSERRVLLILVTSDGDVQNRILQTERIYSASELTEAAHFLNEYCSGKTLAALSHIVQKELVSLKSDIVSLMNAAVAVGAELSKRSDSVVIAGEHQLLGVGDLSSNVARMRQLFALFEQKTALLQLLDLGNHADGVKIYIGGESGLAPLDECSVITAPYRVNGEIVGTLGVIGPTRMDYERVIPIVDITAQLLSSALSL
ncbi:heat-inducible transcriptional repressor HrcA [Iodobacter fluviatilis]|uniref:Heat-inducible transcription repressor HrcA n=1 Tax=Iodobacter fluviatilis TaxID=537 RepID=A0A377QD59_9NEIS|nr:heat-inducible transcriptional repressor HrcA [Iodobacter fluviatilis]TCU83682.1 heat-inducible transcription repressor HrcA [Iodobacter fluviatilis]STQ91811.1 Heat-inducible transcription repressor HrcA [Iodobacter fluviatilis]